MIKNSILCALLLTLSALAQGGKRDSQAEQNRLLVLEHLWNEAQVNRDSGALASMIGDEFVSTEYDGEVSDRAKFLADIENPTFKPSQMNIGDVKVLIFGDAAIVTGTYRTKGTFNAKPYQHVGRFTDTWIFLDNKWECMASHSSHVKK